MPDTDDRAQDATLEGVVLDHLMTIAVDDPLLEAFALQHDLRERFAHALEEILGVLDRRSLDDASGALREVQEIVRDAISPDSIRGWLQNARPLPWLDERLGDGPERVRQAVLRMVGEGGNIS